MVHLPNIIEKLATGLFADNYSGTYGIYRGFSSASFELPCAVSSVGRITELEPDSHIYVADFAVVVLTNIDDFKDEDSEDAAVEAHDSAVESFSLLMADFGHYANAHSSMVHVDGFYLNEVQQGREDRQLITTLSYVLHVERIE